MTPLATIHLAQAAWVIGWALLAIYSARGFFCQFRAASAPNTYATIRLFAALDSLGFIAMWAHWPGPLRVMPPDQAAVLVALYIGGAIVALAGVWGVASRDGWRP